MITPITDGIQVRNATYRRIEELKRSIEADTRELKLLQFAQEQMQSTEGLSPAILAVHNVLNSSGVGR
jgi:hypothetical protein